VLTLNSYAKVNLYLRVLNKRKDGYHTIETVFERIDLCDKIILKPRGDNLIKIISGKKGLPKDRTNLAFRAARLLKDKYRIDKGVDIEIIKRIPIGSGLGGGSSNAASVLSGLNRLWKLGLPLEELADLGGKIGSDVPFFIYNCRFALGKGKGDKITPLPGLEKISFDHVLAVPKIHVSTPLIYKNWDKLRSQGRIRSPQSNPASKNKYLSGLTRQKSGVKIIVSSIKKKDLLSLNKAALNSLEPVTERLYPQVESIKNKFLVGGAQFMLMSGSGPAVFGIVPSRKEAVGLFRQLKRENRLWQVFLARTI
jgi:4-diphosphocytidyl-2-C-methyl-D-erythritol kinase